MDPGIRVWIRYTYKHSELWRYMKERFIKLKNHIRGWFTADFRICIGLNISGSGSRLCHHNERKSSHSFLFFSNLSSSISSAYKKIFTFLFFQISGSSISAAYKLQVLNQRVCTYDNVCIAYEEAEETIDDSMHEDPEHDRTLCFQLKFL